MTLKPEGQCFGSHHGAFNYLLITSEFRKRQLAVAWSCKGAASLQYRVCNSAILCNYFITCFFLTTGYFFRYKTAGGRKGENEMWHLCPHCENTRAGRYGHLSLDFADTTSLTSTIIQSNLCYRPTTNKRHPVNKGQWMFLRTNHPLKKGHL